MGNPIRAGRDVDHPWARFEHFRADWEWRILKVYKQGNTAAKDEFARAFCAVMSPYTYGSWEYGDVYLKDIFEDTPGILQVDSTEEFEQWLDEYREAGGTYRCRG